MKYPTLAHFRHLRNFSSLFTKACSTTVENVRQISPFYAKQSQFDGDQNEHKLIYDKYIRNFVRWLRPKNKANSNPIKPKTNPIQSQFNPKQTQNKPNQTQFDERTKLMHTVYIQRIKNKNADRSFEKRQFNLFWRLIL